LLIIRKVICQLCQLCLFYKKAILAQKCPQLCLGSELWPLLEKLFPTLPTLTNLKRSKIIPKVFLTLPWVSTLPIIRKVLSQLCQLCLSYKELKLAQKFPKFANFALGVNFAYY